MLKEDQRLAKALLKVQQRWSMVNMRRTRHNIFQGALHKVHMPLDEFRETKLQGVLAVYGSLLCRPFCEKLYTTLPRELRDAVYYYLSPPETIAVDENGEISIDRSVMPHFCADTTTASNHLGTSHIWQANYMGDKICRELAEHWYRTSTFTFDSLDSSFLRTLVRLFSEDRWRLGTMPRDLITNLEIRIPIEAFDEASDNRDKVHNGTVQRLEPLLLLRAGIRLRLILEEFEVRKTRMQMPV